MWEDMTRARRYAERWKVYFGRVTTSWSILMAVNLVALRKYVRYSEQDPSDDE